MTTELTQIIPQHVQEFLGRTDAMGKGLAMIGDLESQEDFIKADQHLEATEKTAAILRGFLYLHYKQSSDSRNFLAFLENRGISKSTAYDYMDQAMIYAELPNSDMCATVAQLGHSKTRLLKALPKEERDNFLAGQELNGTTVESAASMTKAEFKEFVADYQRSINVELIKTKQQCEDLKTRLDTAQNELIHQQEVAKEKYADIKLPPWALAVREEAAVHGELGSRHVAGLEQALGVLKTYHDRAHESSDDLANYRAAASVTFYNIANLVVQAQKALEHAKTFLGDAEVGDFDMSLPLTETEAKSISNVVQQLNEKLDIEQTHRVSTRIAKQDRVGAPKKNPNVYEDEI